MNEIVSAPVLELVVFKLHQGTEPDGFLATEPAMTEWIGEQPGFVAYGLLWSQDTRHWVFVGWWHTVGGEGRRGASPSVDRCAPMFALIDQATPLFLHAEAVRSVRGGQGLTA